MAKVKLKDESETPMSERLRRSIAAIASYSPEKRVDLLVRAGALREEEREKAVANMRLSLERDAAEKRNARPRGTPLKLSKASSKARTAAG